MTRGMEEIYFRGKLKLGSLAELGMTIEWVGKEKISRCARNYNFILPPPCHPERSEGPSQRIS